MNIFIARIAVRKLNGVSNMEELKKWPFCGGEAILIKTICLNNNYEGYFVQHDCKMTIAPIEMSNFTTEKLAIKAWNRRVKE